MTVISSPAESLVSFQAQSADSVQAPRTRPRWTCPTPRHDPTSGAYAFSASWSARRPGATLSLSSTARTVTAAAATTPSAANRPTPDETLALRIVDSPPLKTDPPVPVPDYCRMKPRPEAILCFD